ncbi:uncharacterized protein BO72DRAFT_451966 [Aspergillus fijiensis CBS 313.89]|uniref:F-box domain-containing protein n=1 Tax=Aspergillus fijiensis CBS 313.89 TaxID=1448319 RepID=A0A8G1VUP5_9EURO|nr:uncharacterized protein BO72DRAFT_451966 [Aspergillus fijiensis CBS 313.89]RAK73292.1 hypothetical protein BO72DRAFT_451966 [Aspergillus fijiensis CBS 313.89]
MSPVNLGSMPTKHFPHITRYLDEATFLSLRQVSRRMHYLVEPMTEAIFARYLETVETNLSYHSLLRIHCDLARPRGNPLAALVKRLVIRYPYTGPNSPFNRLALSSEIEDPLALPELWALRCDLVTAFTECRDFEFHLDEPADWPVDCIHAGDVVRVMFTIFNDAGIPLERLKIHTSLRSAPILEQPTTTPYQVLQLPNWTVPTLYPEVLRGLRVLYLHDDYFREYRGTSIVWELLEGTPALEELRIVGRGREHPTGNTLEALSTARLASARIRVFSVRKIESTAEILRTCIRKMAVRGLETLELRDLMLTTRATGESWEEVLQSVWRMCVDLTRINFRNLGARDERTGGVRRLLQTGCRLTVSVRQMILEQLVEKARRMRMGGAVQ